MSHKSVHVLTLTHPFTGPFIYVSFLLISSRFSSELLFQAFCANRYSFKIFSPLFETHFHFFFLACLLQKISKLLNVGANNYFTPQGQPP